MISELFDEISKTDLVDYIDTDNKEESMQNIFVLINDFKIDLIRLLDYNTESTLLDVIQEDFLAI